MNNKINGETENKYLKMIENCQDLVNIIRKKTSMLQRSVPRQEKDISNTTQLEDSLNALFDNLNFLAEDLD